MFRHTKTQSWINIKLNTNSKTSLPKEIWEQPHCHPARQKMDSPAVCASCAMPTADESNLYIHPAEMDT